MGWVKSLLDRLVSIQDTVLGNFSEEKKQAGYGRAAQLIIDGPEGGVFDLCFSEQGVKPRPDDMAIKNVVYMSEETLLDLLTPNVELDKLPDIVKKEGGVNKAIMQLYPRLDFRTAVANRLITISGDKSDIDSEEWARILETVMLKLAFPIIIRGMLRTKQEKRVSKN